MRTISLATCLLCMISSLAYARGLKLNFKVDEDYLVLHTLAGGSGGGDLRNFQNRVWDLKRPEYRHLQNLRDVSPEEATACSLLKELVGSAKKTEEYKLVLSQTEAYRRQCKKRWDALFKKTASIMQALTGLSFDKKFTILITHPKLNNGQSLGEGRIAWGHPEDWPNYDVVYLWHEVLHSFLPPDQVAHAIIQFLTDDELRTRLNGGGYPPFVGHERLRKLQQVMLADWKAYLAAPKRDVLAFHRAMAAKYKSWLDTPLWPPSADRSAGKSQ